MFKHFEVAVSRYTFADDELKEHLVQVALTAVTYEELAALLSTYQLRYVHSALHQNKAVAIGSANVHPAPHGEQCAARIFYGMVVYSHDGAPPTEASIPYLIKAFELELRERPSSSSTTRQGASTPNLSALRGSSTQISQAAL
ncbi:hypothetical protein HX878_22385 [Pseudomonas veronii]|uniref:hypothetical protein n=1 Tax=Pseudomonas veronii TaxID=76761 RepID=UPI0015A409E4|nr:hypothetical protein [Pseudomonas veronii]NWD57476.1 hypothetical protein [Pseudomonas veronii]